MVDVHAWLDEYRDQNKVEGWLDRKAFVFLHLILKAHRGLPFPTPGGVMEIGVHHGRFFIALNALVEDTSSKSVAVDVFDQQFLNIDNSGRGNLQKFRENLLNHDRHRGENVVIEPADSTMLEPDVLIAKAGQKFKVISIDGGHTAEHTLSDLKLANAVLQPYGFVIVDDISNVHWLGVIDGVVRYLHERPTLWPLAVGYNKLVLCKMSTHGHFTRMFQENFKFAKSTKLCGYTLLATPFH